MNWTIMKNNVKLMFRNKLVILLAVFGPIIIIAALSSAFHDMLDSNFEKSDFVLGYAIENNSSLAGNENMIFDALEKQGVTCMEYPQDAATSLIQDKKTDVFLVAKKDGCTLYSLDTGSVQTRICQFALCQFKQGMELQQLTTQQLELAAQQAGSQQTGMQQPISQDNSSLTEKKLEGMKTAQATDYYGIIEIIYFIWICMIFLSPVVQSERRNRIQSRFIASPTSNLKLYLGKFIPCASLGIICTTLSIVISTLLFDIHWDNYGMSAVILLLTILAATAFGLFCLYIVNNLAVSVVILFVIVWVGGFVGGSFETYMFSSCSESLKRLSPLYYANRTLVEYSTNGSSDYTLPCIIYLGIMTIVFTVIGILLMKRKMEEK